MSADYLMGTDIGTQGTKTIISDAKGKVISSAFEEYDVLQPKPSWAEQWPDVWEEAAYKTIRGSLQKCDVAPKKIVGIGISGLYGGSGIPVDDKFNPLRPCLIWMDRRSTEEVEWIKSNVDLHEVFEITGNYVDTYFGYPKMLWIKNNEPKVWDKIAKFIPPSSYVAFKFTNELAVDFSSAGNIGGIFDLKNLCWSERLCSQLGIPKDYMPQRLVSSNSIIGEVTSKAAKRTGLLQGTPVIAGGIDAPMASLSSGAVERGDNVAMMGTSTCWGIIHDGENLSPKLVSMPHVANPQTKIYTWGGSATSGALARWFRDQFAFEEVQKGKTTKVDPFKLLDKKADSIPAGSEGLIVLPYFMGERSPIWDPMARGTILGLTLYHKKAHLFRALLESAGYSLRHNMEVGAEIGIPLKPTCNVVGGVSKSNLWTQILADVTGKKMAVPSGGVGAPLGDAFLVGIATGMIKEYDEIEEWTELERVHDPDPQGKAVYDKYYRIYRDLYDNIQQNMHELASIEED